MADKLASASDLASLLQITMTAEQTARAEMLIECATAVVQQAAGNQRIVEVEDDPGEQMGTTDSWLWLPQRPVTAISDVEIDGEALTVDTDFKRFGSRLWRECGWAECWTEPSTITYVYTHGYATGSQDLQLARSAVLSLTRGVWDNPTGAVREAIDDYSVAFEAMAATMDASPYLSKALAKKYGIPAGLVRIG